MIYNLNSKQILNLNFMLLLIVNSVSSIAGMLVRALISTVIVNNWQKKLLYENVSI